MKYTIKSIRYDEFDKLTAIVEVDMIESGIHELDTTYWLRTDMTDLNEVPISIGAKLKDKIDYHHRRHSSNPLIGREFVV